MLFLCVAEKEASVTTARRVRKVRDEVKWYLKTRSHGTWDLIRNEVWSCCVQLSNFLF